MGCLNSDGLAFAVGRRPAPEDELHSSKTGWKKCREEATQPIAAEEALMSMTEEARPKSTIGN
jgi:hypothetical protein